jgi:hypothetical protein
MMFEDETTDELEEDEDIFCGVFSTFVCLKTTDDDVVRGSLAAPVLLKVALKRLSRSLQCVSCRCGWR